MFNIFKNLFRPNAVGGGKHKVADGVPDAFGPISRDAMEDAALDGFRSMTRADVVMAAEIERQFAVIAAREAEELCLPADLNQREGRAQRCAK